MGSTAGAGTEPSALPTVQGRRGVGTVPAKQQHLGFVFLFYYSELNLNKQSLLRGGKPSPLSHIRAHLGVCWVPGAGLEEGARAEVSR